VINRRKASWTATWTTSSGGKNEKPLPVVDRSFHI
jgi:hypothetical protein